MNLDLFSSAMTRRFARRACRPTLEKISVNIEVCTESQSGNDMLAKRKFRCGIIDCDDLPNGLAMCMFAPTQKQFQVRSLCRGEWETTTRRPSGRERTSSQKPLTPLHAARLH